jgi:cytochrome c553
MNRLSVILLLSVTAGLGLTSRAPDTARVSDDSFVDVPDSLKHSSDLSIVKVCIECHEKRTPGIVRDWKSSEHRKKDVTCISCHGNGHMNAEDVSGVRLPTPEVCGTCHAERVEQFSRGKHALAWTVLNAVPVAHWLPNPMIEGMKGCGGCHKIGLKTDAEIERLKLTEGGGFGTASCDACHTRHTFSVSEARSPEACRTCHNGPDHPHWDMYDGSKHGVRNSLKQQGVISKDAAGPTCQTCHMPGGNHEVRTAWGFFAVRLPLPADEQWAADRATILRAMGALDATGEPTAKLNGFERADLLRLTEEDWQASRDQMLAVCAQCHSRNFAKAQLENGDEMIRNADRLMAEAISTVGDLYRDGILVRADAYQDEYPDLLTFFEAGTPIELKLYEMFLHHRMKAFQGVFHSNPEYALWHGWSKMVQALAEIEEMARDLRE